MSEGEWVTGKVGLKIGRYPLDLEMTVPAKPVKPHRMLPIFHQMANSFADIGVQAVEAEGKSISCKAGCGACCRQPVPITEIEIYQLAELVNEMPEPKRTIVKKRFNEAMTRFRSAGWFDEFKEQYDGGRQKTSHKQMRKALRVVHEYFLEGVACPFLEDESCSIHPNRPISCREYLVTSPPANCAKLSADGIHLVPLPIQPSKSVEQLARSGVTRKEGMPLLIMALELAEKYPEDLPEKTGEQWMADFFGHLIKNEADKEKRNAVPETGSRTRRKRRW